MHTTFFVKDHEAALAREIEKRLVSLENSGILFVGVAVIEAPLSSPEMRQVFYNVYIGCDRSMAEGAVEALAYLTLRSIIRTEALSTPYQVYVRRGITKKTS